jgi:protein transport protein SEC61 subunit gamma and related proteins
MEVADFAYKPAKEFAKDSIRLIRKCTKPDKKEFSKVALRTGMGFIVMGFVGFFVKLILCVAVLARSPSSSSSSSPSSSSSSSSSSLARRVASSFLLVRRDRRARGGRGGEVDRPTDRPIARPRRVASFVTINYSARRFPLSSFRAAIDRSRD